MADDFLPCSTAQLNLDVVLANGQSFRWMREEGGRNSWIGTAHHRLWRLWRPDGNRIEFEILCKFHNESDESEVEKNGADILKEYFQLDVNLGELYQLWASKCAHFKKFMADDPRTYEGIRILRQHPVEALFAFICSANNNIARITKMVEKLCQLYGTSVDLPPNDVDGSRRVYDFPSISQLRANLPGMESRLRDAGFGYRAASIARTVALFSQPEWISKHGEADQWLLSLRQAPYEDARQALLQLPGVGPKVADCVCLMALGKHAVVPVDTHVFRLTAEIYKPAFITAKKANRANTTKTTMKYSTKLNPQIGQYYAELFGPYAGWAQSILFTTRLRQFKK